MPDLENGMVLGGGDAFRQEIDEESYLADVRRATNRAIDALNVLRTEDAIVFAVDQIQFYGAAESDMVDDLVNSFENANGRLELRAWRLLRTMLASEIRLRVTVRQLLGRPGDVQ